MKCELKVFFKFLHTDTSRSQVENKLSQKTLVSWCYTLTNRQRQILAVVFRAFVQVSSLFRYALRHSRNKWWLMASQRAG